jgi:hypothetical protein
VSIDAYAVSNPLHTVTIATAGATIAAGKFLQLANAEGQTSCLGAPLGVDLEVESVVGAVITFVAASHLTARGEGTNCVITRADIIAECAQDGTGQWTTSGGAVIDVCGICEGFGDTCLDCAGAVNDGLAVRDDCGVCDTDSTSDCLQDCAGRYVYCTADGARIEEVPTRASPLDAYACTGTNVVVSARLPGVDEPLIDACFVCDGDGTSCLDCAGTPQLGGGGALEDACGVCDTDTTNDCTADCMGAFLLNPTEVDVCGVCGGDGTGCDDCAGAHAAMYCSTDGTVAGVTGEVPARITSGRWACADGTMVMFALPGPNAEDICGTCDSDTANDCTMDCTGVFGGGATVTECVLPDGARLSYATLPAVVSAASMLPPPPG